MALSDSSVMGHFRTLARRVLEHEDTMWSLIVHQAILRPTVCDELYLSGYWFSYAFWILSLLLGFAPPSR